MPECHQIQWIWANPVDLQAFPAWTRGFTKVKCKQLTNNRKKWTIFHSQFENWAIVHIYGGHTWWPKNHMKPINSGSELRPRPVHRMESGSQTMTNAIAMKFGEEHQESRPTPQHFTFNHSTTFNHNNSSSATTFNHITISRSRRRTERVRYMVCHFHHFSSLSSFVGGLHLWFSLNWVKLKGVRHFDLKNVICNCPFLYCCGSLSLCNAFCVFFSREQYKRVEILSIEEQRLRFLKLSKSDADKKSSSQGHPWLQMQWYRDN